MTPACLPTDWRLVGLIVGALVSTAVTAFVFYRLGRLHTLDLLFDAEARQVLRLSDKAATRLRVVKTREGA